MLQGYLYEKGLGVPKHFYEAVSHYQAASGKDFPSADEALIKLDSLTYVGMATNPNNSYQPECQYQLSLAYRNGSHGLPRDMEKSFDFAKLAAAHHHPRALCELAYKLKKGFGCSVDYKAAIAAFQDAAGRGSAEANNKLGFYYETARCGLTRSLELAKVYYEVAAHKGSEDAKKSLARLGLKFIPQNSVPITIPPGMLPALPPPPKRKPQIGIIPYTPKSKAVGGPPTPTSPANNPAGGRNSLSAPLSPAATTAAVPMLPAELLSLLTVLPPPPSLPALGPPAMMLPAASTSASVAAAPTATASTAAAASTPAATTPPVTAATAPTVVTVAGTPA